MTTPAAGTTVETPFIDDYLARNQGLTLTPSTVTTYRSQLELFARFLTSRGTTVPEADRRTVVAFIESCVRDGNRKSTLEGKLSVIQQLYRHIKLRTDAADDLNLDPLRLETIDLSRYNTPPPIEREALSREEVRRLFDAMESYRNRLLALTATATGLRNSDLREIHIDDIEFEALKLHVPNPKNMRPYDIPLTRDLAFDLEWWLETERKAYLNATESNYLFPARGGTKLHSNGSLNRIIKDAAEKAGIQEVIGESTTRSGAEPKTHEWHRVTPHTLRHTYLTLLKEDGVSLPNRQLVANHAKPDTTRGYTHGRDGVFNTIRDKFTPPK